MIAGESYAIIGSKRFSDGEGNDGWERTGESGLFTDQAPVETTRQVDPDSRRGPEMGARMSKERDTTYVHTDGGLTATETGCLTFVPF